MSTSHFSVFLHDFLLTKLATSSIRVRARFIYRTEVGSLFQGIKCTKKADRHITVLHVLNSDVPS